jgi:hypothetical protein
MRLPKERLHLKTPFSLTFVDVQPKLVRRFFRRGAGAGDAGVGDENVKTTVALLQIGRRLLDLIRLGHVHEGDIGLEPRLFHRGTARLCDIAIEIGDDHLGARLRQRAAAGKSDGPAAASDDGDAAVELQFFKIHDTSPQAIAFRSRRCLRNTHPWSSPLRAMLSAPDDDHTEDDGQRGRDVEREPQWLEEPQPQ